jgi:DNA-binding FadR family transcriptional regulator
MPSQDQGVPWWTFDFGRTFRQNISHLNLNSAQVLLVHVLLDRIVVSRSMPTVKELAAPFGITTRAVRGHLQVLEERRYVLREHRNGPNMYHFDGLVDAVTAMSERSHRP